MKRVAQYLKYTPYYAGCILLASALWRSPGVLLIGYVGLSVLMLWRWHRVPDLVFYFLPCALGPIGEAVAIYSGAWQYTRPWLLIPIWLPFAWGCAGLYMKKTADAICQGISKTGPE